MPGIPVQPDGWPTPRGYANGMRARGDFLAVAGQVAWDARGRIVSDHFAGQFEQALRNVVTIVEAGGGTATDIISLTIFVIDKREYLDALGGLGEAYRRAMGGRHYPAMALVEVSGLIESRAKVEIQALAVVPERP